MPVDIKSSDAVEYPDQSPKIVSIKQAMDLNDPVEIIVDFGKGEDARPIISHFEYTGENGNVALKDGGGITVSGDKVTLAATREIYVGKNWKLGFLDSEGKNPYLLDVPLLGEGHETDIDKDPTAEVPESVQVESDGELVTKYNKARHIGDIVTVNVNYGKGLKERTKIAYLEYTVKGNEDKPDQVKQLVPDGSKLLVSATTVNVKMVKALYAAEDWKLVFANEKGGSLYPIEVALKDLENADPVPEGPSGPNITVEEAASAVGNPVKVTFERANMDKVSGVYYRNSTGTAAFLAVGTKNVTLVDDNTLSINAVSALFNGSNWAVRFSSEDGTETQDISFDMMTAAGPLYDSDPTAIVKTAAKAQGNQAVIALTYGTGDAEKTKVIGLAYKNASGAEAMLAVGTKNVSQDGDTLTINAISNVFKGSKWRIRFADENDTSNYKDVAFDLKNTG